MSLATVITESELLIFGLIASGLIIGLIMRVILSAPEREAAAYRAGVTDESRRREQEISEMRSFCADREVLRQALLRLSLTVDLTDEQRAEVAQALGYKVIDIVGPNGNGEGSS